MSAPRLGSLTLSIDWELEIGRGSAAQLRWVDELTPELVALLDSLGMPATWGVADPARSAATEAILASTQPHELAILGDRNWLGWGAGGSRATRELTRRVLGAAARQIPIHSLVLFNESSIAQSLPLLELGIRTIRQPIGHEVLRPAMLAKLPRSLRLVERVQRMTLPRWWNWWEGLQLDDGCGTCHLGFEAAQLCQAGPRGWRKLTAMLMDLARLRDRLGRDMLTLKQWNAAERATERQAA
jgi:hypothetical protein